MTPAEKIDAIIKERGLSRRQIAIKAKIPPSTFQSAMERKENISIDMIEKIASALNVNFYEIATDVGETEEAMSCIGFYRAMKTHCQSMNAECENCCMRLYCYTPPCEKTDSMMEKVISFLATERNCNGNENHSDHRSEVVQMPCPCNMDMSTALGYESH